MTDVKQCAQQKNSSEVTNFVQNVLRKSNHSILKYIRVMLVQHSLDPSQAMDIFLEAYNRALRYEKKIAIPEAWLKSVCLNIIREKKRDQQRHEELDDCYHHSLPSLGQKNWFDLDDAFVQGLPVSSYNHRLIEEWEKLSERERQVLTLRFILELSWKSVSDVRSSEEAKPVTEASVRKQGNRALKKLREGLEAN
jgi:DNA-directed RNA polymerase specialized sigma24 family protein